MFTKQSNFKITINSLLSIHSASYYSDEISEPILECCQFDPMEVYFDEILFENQS